jgi:hypothetical protein
MTAIKLPKPILTSYSVDGERFDLYSHASLVHAVRDALEEASVLLDTNASNCPRQLDTFLLQANAIEVRALKEQVK